MVTKKFHKVCDYICIKYLYVYDYMFKMVIHKICVLLNPQTFPSIKKTCCDSAVEIS